MPKLAQDTEVQNHGAVSISAQEGQNPEMQYNFSPLQLTQAQNFISPEQVQSILMLLQKVSLQQAVQNQKNKVLEDQFKEMRLEITSLRNASRIQPNEARFESGPSYGPLKYLSIRTVSRRNPMPTRILITAEPTCHLLPKRLLGQLNHGNKQCATECGSTNGLSVAEFIFRHETMRNQYR